MHFRYHVLWVPICLCLSGFLLNTERDERDEARSPKKVLVNTEEDYTTAGNIALTVSNFGTIGTRNAYWPDQPSCEYPRGSRIEHLYQGGLWVGAIKNGQIHVSTGSSDRVSTTTGKGFEFTSDYATDMIERSTLSESRYFSEDAVSHQDFVGYYNDFVPRDSTEPDRSFPLGISVRQESYAWNFPFADFFVILNYTIYNAGSDTLDSIYLGLWENNVVRNTNNVRPGTPGYFSHGANGYLDSLRMLYTFDFDGIPTPPPADSYVGVKLLGTFPFPGAVDSLADLRLHTYYNAWRFNTSVGDQDYFSPIDDADNSQARSRYERLASSLPQPKVAALRLNPDNITTLLSVGPFAKLAPGDSLNVVFGVICARKSGSGPARNDTREQRATLLSNAKLCQQAYDGEDLNGNNELDPGEDLNGNLRLDHYQLPQPPHPPKVHLEVNDQDVAVYWDKSTSELSLDPVTRQYDFEGYRIYRSNAGADLGSPEDFLLNLSLAGEFDRSDDAVGYNTGFSAVTLPRAVTFPGDTVAYWYRFPPKGTVVPHLNGWQYLYGVAAFDRGDSAAGITSLQSKTEIRRAVPGTSPAAAGQQPGVYPNPYYANAIWDAAGERNRKIYFYNLPGRCEIRIYTLAGDVVADILHDGATYDGTDIEWFKRFGGTGIPPQFAGGEHAWDLVTKFDQAIATGLYLYSIKDVVSGSVYVGKFLVIK